MNSTFFSNYPYGNDDKQIVIFTSTGRSVFLRQLASLIPHEYHDEIAAHRLAEMIVSEGVWTAPVAVEAASSVILDGHHRCRAARLLGLVVLPTVAMAYDDPGLKLTAWRLGEIWNAELVLQRAKLGSLLPHKTTRHLFSPPIGEVSVSLELLRSASGCSPRTAEATTDT